MRVLFISNYSQLYGANRSLLSIIEYLKSRGNEVLLLLPSKGNICDELNDKHIPYTVQRCFTQLYYYKLNIKYLALPFLDVFTYLRLPFIKRRIKAFNPDLIYSNTSAENIGIKLAKSLGIKHISHIREFMDLDHGAKFIYGNKAKMDYINQSDGVIYVSKAVAQHVNMGKTLKDWQRVIYNGVRYNETPFKERLLGKDINLGVVGIFDKEKGQDVAIKILPEIRKVIPNAKLHLWGDKEGSYKRILIKLVQDLCLEDCVVFHGFEKDPNRIYKNMNVLLMCSRCEGFGRVTIEAMQRGIPVLGYKSGGTVELIKDGSNGYLFENTSQCVDGLQRLTSSQEVYNSISKNAYEYSRTNFSDTTYCINVESFINEIMNTLK